MLKIKSDCCLYNDKIQGDKRSKIQDYSYLLFYHPSHVNPDGSVVFITDLVKMKVSVKNAEKIFKKAVKIVEGEMPASSKDCGFCGWCEG